MTKSCTIRAAELAHIHWSFKKDSSSSDSTASSKAWKSCTHMNILMFTVPQNESLGVSKPMLLPHSTDLHWRFVVGGPLDFQTGPSSFALHPRRQQHQLSQTQSSSLQVSSRSSAVASWSVVCRQQRCRVNYRVLNCMYGFLLATWCYSSCMCIFSGWARTTLYFSVSLVCVCSCQMT